jgi:curved DNA-binding protein
MEYRDYYKILGVERAATADQVKTAYRRLARKYHPDVSKEKNAEERFKEVQEAYEVLKDPEKRAAYDQLGADWKSGEQFRPPPDWGSGFEHAGAGPGPQRGRGRAGGARGRSAGAAEGYSQADFSDFFSSLFGGETGFSPGGATSAAGSDHHARVDIDLEEAYRGTTRTLELRRPEVKPDGTVALANHTVRVTIPAGVTEGQLIRLAGQGAPGPGGGPPGDLYLEAHILPHKLFELDGRDVTLSFPVAPWEAALGASVNVPTLGGAVAMQVPPNSQSGQKLRLRGRGLPGTPPGDQYLQLKVVLPAATTPEAKALYEQMRDKLSFDPRADLAR